MKEVIRRLGQGDLGEVQVAALFALGFFGFLHWDDLSRLTVDNLQFADTHLAVILTQRKNDQFRNCLLYTSPSPRDGLLSRMPSSA